MGTPADKEPWRDMPATAVSGADSHADGAPYRPANGTEGADFEDRWCMRCASDDYEAGEYCPILNTALCGEQPAEWIYENRRPKCTAFVPFDGMKPLPEPRCPLTMEMF